MQKKRIKKRKRFIAFGHVTKIYSLFVIVATGFCLLFPLETTSEKVSFFVGVAGTLASLYSIIVSEKDEVRSKKEKKENRNFLIALKKDIDYVLSDTSTIKTNMKQFVNNYVHSNVSDGTDSNKKSKELEQPKEVWGRPNDELQPS